MQNTRSIQPQVVSFLAFLFFALFSSAAGAEENVLPAEVFKPSLVNISGYIQVQSYYEDRAEANVATGTSESGMRIRRARLKSEGEVAPGFSYELQLNANESSVSLEDAFVNWQIVDHLAIKAGRFTIPFGDEIYLTSRKNPFVEKSRYWAYLFNENRNIGSEVKWDIGPLALQLAYFHTYTNGQTNPREQDIAARLVYDGGRFYLGLSAYYDDQYFKNVLTTLEITYNAFVGIRGENWLFKAETVYLDAPVNGVGLKLNGFGWHTSFTWNLTPSWELMGRFAYHRLANSSVQVRELGIGGVLSAPVITRSYEGTLGCAYHFARYTTLTFNYTPSLHPGNIWAHAVVLQAQVAF